MYILLIINMLCNISFVKSIKYLFFYSLATEDPKFKLLSNQTEYRSRASIQGLLNW
jgi:hypothetical protein